MDYGKESLKMHYQLKGKIEVTSGAGAADQEKNISKGYSEKGDKLCSQQQFTVKA